MTKGPGRPQGTTKTYPIRMEPGTYEQLKELNGYSGMIITKAARKHIEIEIETAKEFIELLRTKDMNHSGNNSLCMAILIQILIYL